MTALETHWTGEVSAAKGVATVSLVGLLVGCGTPGGTPPECHEFTGDSRSVEVAHLAGEFRLVVVSTQEPHLEERADVRLELVAQDLELRTIPGITGEPLPGVEQPLRGILRGDLGAVGAVVPGDLLSEDPRAPGVAVLRMDATEAGDARVIVRLGSEANQRERLAFDEAFTVLRVRATEKSRFFGEWESGNGGEGARGYFCGYRSQP